MPDTAKLDLTAIPEDLRVSILVLVQASQDFIEHAKLQPEIFDRPGMEPLRRLCERAVTILASVETQSSSRR